MLNLVKKNIIENNLIENGDNVLLGFSGGPDSVFLFHCLRKLKEELSFNLYASHINHMYRGEDAKHDEEFVRSICQEHGVRLFVKRKHAGELARELKKTEEEAGRILRYGFFKENLDEVGGGKIAVAHNLNDQAETVLQRIIRGTGIDGLSAMSFKKDNIIRPMLNISKPDIISYLNENNYEYCIDKTNLQDIYGRNKIRLNLIPYLEKYNPNIQNTLFRMSQTMERDKKIIEKYIEEKFNMAKLKENDNRIILDLTILKKMDESELGRIIRRTIEELQGSTVNLEMKHIDYAIDFIHNGSTGKKINLSQGFTTEISYDNFIINKVVENIDKFQYNIVLNNTMYIPEVNKSVTATTIKHEDYNNEDKDSISIDYDRVKGCLVVRNRRAGDFMIPCGMTGSKKIKDIFIDLKIPAEERDKRLIFTDDENIIYAEGFRIHNDYKITSSTNHILNIIIRSN